MKVWTGNEMERRGGEWDREMTAGRIRTRVPRGRSSPYMVGATACATVPPMYGIFMVHFVFFSKLATDNIWC